MADKRSAGGSYGWGILNLQFAICNLQYLVSQLRRHALVGIQEQHPIRLAQIERAVALGRKAAPGLDNHSRAMFATDIGGAVAGAAVEQHQHLASHARDAVERRADVALLVFGDNGDRERRPTTDDRRSITKIGCGVVGGRWSIVSGHNWLTLPY